MAYARRALETQLPDTAGQGMHLSRMSEARGLPSLQVSSL